VPGEQALRSLRDAETAFLNLRGTSQDAYPLHTEYIKVAHEQARVLSYALPPREVDRLITTQRHWALAAFDSPGRPRALAQMLETEFDEKCRALKSAVDELVAYRQRFAGTQHVVVPDTNVLLQHPSSYPNVAWSELLPPGVDHAVLGVAMVVVDELDRAKLRTTNNVHGEALRKRAGRTLKALEAALAPDGEDTFDAAGITMSVRLLDPEWDRERTGPADVQIINAGLEVRDSLGVPTTAVSDDLGMRLRARSAGLTAVASPGADDRD
jgi:hypothetical protein